MYDKIFLPLHHQNTDRDDTPTRGKTIFYVHEKNLPRVGTKKAFRIAADKNQTKILTSTDTPQQKEARKPVHRPLFVLNLMFKV